MRTNLKIINESAIYKQFLAAPSCSKYKNLAIFAKFEHFFSKRHHDLPKCSYLCCMNEKEKELLYEKLRTDIEAKSGMRLKHRSDFVAFADLLQNETKQRLSDTTLRRFWGYQENGAHSATVRTLDILCAYLGYKNWDEYVECHEAPIVSADATETSEGVQNQPSATGVALPTVSQNATMTEEKATTSAKDTSTTSVENSAANDTNVSASHASTKRWKWIAAAAGVVLAAGAALACLQSRDFSQDGIEYRVASYLDGRVAVAACSKDAKGHVSVPEMVSNWGRTYCVTALDEEAFYGCKGLTEVVLPAGVETIGDRAFKCCENLSSIEMQDGVTKLGTELFRTCPRLKDVRLSKSLLALPEYCFSGDSIGLTSLVLPNGIRTIGRDAFGKCKELKRVHMPENLETLGRGAFWECRKLEHVTLPRSLRSMGDVEFWYCDHLQSITLLCPTPPAVDSPFEKERTAPVLLRVPKDNVDAYRASSWASLNIEPFEE